MSSLHRILITINEQESLTYDLLTGRLANGSLSLTTQCTFFLISFLYTSVKNGAMALPTGRHARYGPIALTGPTRRSLARCRSI